MVSILGLMAIGVVLTASWKVLYFWIYPQERFIGDWRIDLESVVYAEDPRRPVRDEAIVGQLRRDEGLVLGFRRDGRAFVWWNDPEDVTEDDEPSFRYRVSDEIVHLELTPDDTPSYPFRFESLDRLILQRWVDGSLFDVPYDRVSD